MKKRNLFIGIALVAVILVALYLANYRGILEGNTGAGKQNNTVTNIPAPDNKTALKTIEDILSGALKMDGKGTDDLTEYINDLTNNSVCLDVGVKTPSIPVNKIIKIEKNKHPIIEMNDIPAPTKLSYNDTFQVIYAAGKIGASAPTAGSDMINILKTATPYFYLYSAFTSKLLVNIQAVLKSKDDPSKQLLSNILNKYTYTVTDEGPKTNSVNISFVSTLAYSKTVVSRIYQMGTTGWPATTKDLLDKDLVFFLCNYSGKTGYNKPTAGVLNYTIPSILTEIETNVPESKVRNANLGGTEPYFIQLLQSSTQATVDNGTIFAKYKIPTFVADLEKSNGSLKVALLASEKNPKGNVTYPAWFSVQPAAAP